MDDLGVYPYFKKPPYFWHLSSLSHSQLREDHLLLSPTLSKMKALRWQASRSTSGKAQSWRWIAIWNPTLSEYPRWLMGWWTMKTIDQHETPHESGSHRLPFWGTTIEAKKKRVLQFYQEWNEMLSLSTMEIMYYLLLLITCKSDYRIDCLELVIGPLDMIISSLSKRGDDWDDWDDPTPGAFAVQ